MSKARTRKLKVFAAQFGFHDSVVAAPNQAAALRAWGTRQNLFAEGQARVTTEPDAVKAALAHPEVPLMRAVGSTDAFDLAATSLPDPPAAPRIATRGRRKAQPAPSPRPIADRKALDAAERALRALEDARGRDAAEFRRQREALDAQAAEAEQAFAKARASAKAAVAQARRVYRQAGGRD